MKKPSHVVAEPGDLRSLCGVKRPLPVVAGKHVQMHIDGHNIQLCPDCDRLRVKP